MTDFDKVDSISVNGTVQSLNAGGSGSRGTAVTMVREGFEPDVIKVLREIWGFATGRAVLSGIGSSAGSVLIEPRASDYDVQSEEIPIGRGGLSKVKFEPAVWPTRPNTLNAGEVLLHELVHSLRQVSFVASFEKVSDQPQYEDLEEFYAILIANVYRSEIGRHGLRGGHHVNDVLLAAQHDPQKFLQTGKNRERCDRLRREMRCFFDAVAKAPAKWNPLKALSDVSPAKGKARC